MSALYASLQALALSTAGMAALAFAIDRHHEQLTGADALPATQRVVLRSLGALFLAAALLPCVLAWSASVGVVAMLGFWSLGALLVAGLMSLSPRLMAWMGAGAGLLGACGAVLGLAG